MESHDMEMIPMMMIMEPMDNLSEFYGSPGEMSELPSPELSPGTTTAVNIPHFMDTTTSHDALANLPSFTNQTATTSSFAGPSHPLHEPLSSCSISLSETNYTASSYPPTSSIRLKKNSMAAMREMIFRIAAMQPIHIDPKSVKPPKRRNVRISSDPQSVAARHRRERISEKIRILQRLVPGGTKMDIASMLDEAIHYVKFLKSQVQSLEKVAVNQPPPVGFPVTMASGSYLPIPKAYAIGPNGQHLGDHASFS